MSLCILDIQLANLVSSSVSCLFYLMVLTIKLSSFVRLHRFTVGFSTCWNPTQKILFHAHEFKHVLSSSSTTSRVSGPTLRSVVHLELRFVQDERKRSRFILLHVVIQFDKYQLLKMLPFLQCAFWHFCQISGGCRRLGLYVGP